MVKVASFNFLSDCSCARLLLLQVFGFFATVLFAVDLIMFVKMKGFPFKKDGKPEASNGGPAVGPAQPEEEKLNPPPQ